MQWCEVALNDPLLLAMYKLENYPLPEYLISQGRRWLWQKGMIGPRNPHDGVARWEPVFSKQVVVSLAN
jgi:hypothetical protein